MIAFSAGAGRVHALAYTPDSSSLIVDLRGKKRQHPWLECTFRPATELVWWEIATKRPIRRFRLRDSLYGPGGFQMDPKYNGGVTRPDWDPDQSALELSCCASPLRVATVWEWTNKEDGVCAFDIDDRQVIDLWTPHRTHTQKVSFSPNGTKLAAATINDMDGSALLEVWTTSPRGLPEADEPDEDQWKSGEPDESWWRLGEPSGNWRESNLQDWRDERLVALINGCANPLGPLAELSFDGRFVAAVNGERPKLLLWDSQAALPLAKVPRNANGEINWRELRPHEGTLLDLSFAPTCVALAQRGSLLAAGGLDLALVDPRTLEHVELTRPVGVISTAAFGTDERELLVGTDVGLIEVWDTSSGQLLRTFDWECEPISAAAIAPDGSTFAVGTEEGHIVVWNR